MSPVTRVERGCPWNVSGRACGKPLYTDDLCWAHSMQAKHFVQSVTAPDTNIRPDQLRLAATSLRMDAAHDEGSARDLVTVAEFCEHVAGRMEGGL